MSKLIGTNPNQVPSNADLGSAAFMDAKDFLAARGSSLSAIDAVIPKTATSVFVYDTSRDSDGGAWRKRTQHTSWYKEPLQTAIRGSRREFPSVAVIVGDNTKKVTVYDADDPNLPMWLVFDGGNSNLYTNANGISALNGGICVAISTYGLVTFNLIGDYIGRWRSGAAYEGFRTPSSIADRTLATTGNSQGIPPFVNVYLESDDCYDVDMKVLPNAPIDPATQLPRPTIAVATGGGVGIIKDNGTSISSIYTYNDIYDNASNVSFTHDNRILYNVQNTAVGYTADIPESGNYTYAGYNSIVSGSSLNTYLTQNHGGNVALYRWIKGANVNFSIQSQMAGDTLAFSTSENDYLRVSGGLTLIHENKDSAYEGMRCWIDAAGNTGWMYGDIRSCMLADTTAYPLVPSGNLLTNGDFATGDLTGWSTSGNGTVVYANGGAELTNTSEYGADLYQTFQTVPGEYYRVTFDVTTVSGNGAWYIDNFIGEYVGSTTSVDGTYNFFSKAYATTSTIQFKKRYVGTTRFDNVQVHRVNPERSQYRKGLRPTGSLNRTTVASGSELVSYSGFTSSNYLRGEYDSLIDSLGSKDMCVTFWYKGPSGASGPTQIFASFRSDAGNTGWWQIWTNSANSGIQWGVNDAAGNDHRCIANGITEWHDGQWHQYHFIRRSGVYQIFMDGHSIQTTNNNSNVSWTAGDTTKHLKVGVHHDTNYPVPGEMALLRINYSTVSDYQIKKTFEDEKRLFTPNAKCTIYGDPNLDNPARDMAYDNKNKLLYVTGNQGISIFNGIERVGNIEDSSMSLVSAYNGLVVGE